MVRIRRILNYPIDSNCFVIYDKAVGVDCVIVDPGSEDNSELHSFLENERLTPQYIILTHEHFDHCWGVNALRKKFPTVKLVCSVICSEAIQNIKKNYSVFYQQPGFELAPADILTDDMPLGLDWQGHHISFISAKGHSASGILFVIDKCLFTGDSLIKDIKTVTKLKTGSKEEQQKTISMLNDMKGKGLTVYPGHGDTFMLDDYDLGKALGEL